MAFKRAIIRRVGPLSWLLELPEEYASVIENQQLRRAAASIGYLIWFLVLVRILFISTGNPQTGTAEVLGSHAGLAFWLLVLSLIPYFIARARAKKSGSNISWSYVMNGVTMIALVISLGGFYGRIHSNKQPAIPAPKSIETNQQPHATVVQTAPVPVQLAAPVTLDECYQLQTRQTYVGNVELWQDMCLSAFDERKHPTERARSLCKVATFANPDANPGMDYAGVSTECNLHNPLPACPAKMEFDLENMRCEVQCDMKHGYAPDPSGKSCYLACPDGSWPVYVGYVRSCGLP